MRDGAPWPCLFSFQLCSGNPHYHARCYILRILVRRTVLLVALLNSKDCHDCLLAQVYLDRDTGALVNGSAVETIYLSDNVPVLEGAFNVNGIEVSTLPAVRPPEFPRLPCAKSCSSYFYWRLPDRNGAISGRHDLRVMAMYVEIPRLTRCMHPAAMRFRDSVVARQHRQCASPYMEATPLFCASRLPACILGCVPGTGGGRR